MEVNDNAVLDAVAHRSDLDWIDMVKVSGAASREGANSTKRYKNENGVADYAAQLPSGATRVAHTQEGQQQEPEGYRSQFPGETDRRL